MLEQKTKKYFFNKEGTVGIDTSVDKPADNVHKGILFGILGFISLVMLYTIGSLSGQIYTDSILINHVYDPFAGILIILVLTFIFRGHKYIQTYLISSLIVAYGILAFMVFPVVSLDIFPILSAFLSVMMLRSVAGNSRDVTQRAIIFVFVTTIMFIIGDSMRFVIDPPTFAVAFGSIYDDENPLGVPLLFSNGIVIYGRYLVMTVSLPIIILFTGLAAVLSENYSLIFSFSNKYKSEHVGKSLNSALTVLSCQCEGLTASFPSIVVTLLFSAIIPLIALSIFFVAMTNIFLYLFFVRGKYVKSLERIWGFTGSKYLLPVSIVMMISILVYNQVVVFFGIYQNLSIISSLIISMFIFGILFYTILERVLQFKFSIRKSYVYLLIALSTVFMIMWYIPVLTYLLVSNVDYFIIMSLTSFIGGLLSGFAFHLLGNRGKRFYFQYIPMMYSTLAIVVFYISAIFLRLVYLPFGMTQQLEFSLILWGVSLPFIWLGTNMALNLESIERKRGLML
jgi:hypothetical protein